MLNHNLIPASPKGNKTSSNRTESGLFTNRPVLSLSPPLPYFGSYSAEKDSTPGAVGECGCVSRVFRI